jgi:glycosyltransferase 2 family protein
MTVSAAPWTLRRSGWAFIGLQVAGSVLLLGLVGSMTDLTDVAARFTRADPGWLILGHLTCALQILLVGWRWAAINGILGLRAVELADQLRAVVLMHVAGQVLPTSIGGDALRLLVLQRRGIALGRSALSIMFDRAIGLIGIGLLIIASLVAQTLPKPIMALAAPTTALLLLGVAAISGAKAHWEGILRRLHPHQLDGASAALRSFPAWLSVAQGAFGPHLLNIATAFCAGQALGLDLKFLTLAIALPPAILLATLPVSVAGWGARELVVVATLQTIGVSPADALALSARFPCDEPYQRAEVISAQPAEVILALFKSKFA